MLIINCLFYQKYYLLSTNNSGLIVVLKKIFKKNEIPVNTEKNPKKQNKYNGQLLYCNTALHKESDKLTKQKPGD